MLQIHLIVLSLIGQILAAPGPMDRPLLQKDPNNPLLIYASGKTGDDDRAAAQRSIPPGADLTALGMGLSPFTGNVAGISPFNNLGAIGLRGAGMMGASPLFNNLGAMGMHPAFNRFGTGFGYSNLGVNTLGGINNYNGLNGLANLNAFGGFGGIGGIGGFSGGGINPLAINSLSGMNAGLGYTGQVGLSGLSNGLTGFSSLNQLNVPLNNMNSYLNNGFNGAGLNGFNSFNTGFNGINGLSGVNGFNTINSQYPYTTGYNQFGNSVFGATGNRFNNGRDTTTSSGTSSFDNDSLKRSQMDPTSQYYVQLFDNYGSTNGNREEQQDGGSFTNQKRNASGRTGSVIQHSASTQVRTNQPSL